MASRKEPPKPLPTQPEPDAADRAHAAARVVLEAIPYAGGSLSVLFEQVVMPSLEKRKREWLDDVADHVRRLEAEERLTLDDLKGNEAFVDVVLQASRAALATSSEEKRAALRNAVLNSALPGAPEEAERSIFLRYVEDFTDRHLHLLKFLSNPAAWEERNGVRGLPLSTRSDISLGQVIIAAFPDLEENGGLRETLWDDLRVPGLIVGETTVRVWGRETLQKRTSGWGERFLAFIEEP